MVLGQSLKGVKRGIEGPERGHALDNGPLDQPNPCEIEFSLRSSAGIVEEDFVVAVRGDFTRELFEPILDRAGFKA
jgi:hypothetical protein